MAIASNSHELLRPLRPVVLRARTRYLQSLQFLPKDIRRVVKSHLSSRLRRAHSRPTLGEYAPWLLADLIGVKHTARLDNFSVGWQQMCWGIMILDDVIDAGPANRSPLLLVGSQLLAQAGVCRIIQVVGGRSGMCQSINDAYTRNAAAAAREETRYRRRLGPYRKRDIIALGEKLALLHICVDGLSDFGRLSSRRRVLLHTYFKKLIAGLQLLDDLTDWREDLLGGNITYPLSILVRKRPKIARRSGRGCDDVRDCFRELIWTGAIERTLTAAKQMLVLANAELMSFRGGSTSTAFRYVAALNSSIDDVLQVIARTRDQYEWLDPSKPDRVNDPARKAEEEIALERVRRSLGIVAQSS